MLSQAALGTLKKQFSKPAKLESCRQRGEE
jgi:hypothetical protein